VQLYIYSVFEMYYWKL